MVGFLHICVVDAPLSVDWEVGVLASLCLAGVSVLLSGLESPSPGVALGSGMLDIISSAISSEKTSITDFRGFLDLKSFCPVGLVCSVLGAKNRLRAVGHAGKESPSVSEHSLCLLVGCKVDELALCARKEDRSTLRIIGLRP